MSSDDIDSFERNNSKNLKIGVFVLFLAGLFLLALGTGLFLFKGQKRSDIEIIQATESAKAQDQIIVDVDGAVLAPGVYRLISGARVDDAITAAGGLNSDADRVRLNLAAKLSDGQKLYVQRVGESVNQDIAGSVAQTAGVSTSQLVNINSATESQLDSLPGVGPVTAGKIIASRPYGSLEDLLVKKAVTQLVFEKIKPFITI